MQDPPSGAAAAGNHPVDRHPKHQYQAPVSAEANAAGAVYREPSSWETMVRCELAAGENERAISLLRRFEERAFPEPGESRCRFSDRAIIAEADSLARPPQSSIAFASCFRTWASRHFLSPSQQTRLPHRHQHRRPSAPSPLFPLRETLIPLAPLCSFPLCKECPVVTSLFQTTRACPFRARSPSFLHSAELP